MKRRKWVFHVLPLAMLLAASLSATAMECDVSDIALTPGGDPSRLNITWHAGNAVAGETCTAEVTKDLLNLLTTFSETFSGTWLESANDEYGEAECYCKVTVTGLQSSKDYEYRLTDGDGVWSEAYEYSPGGNLKYGFLFVGDSQIGASGPKSLSKSRDVKPYIGEYKTRLTYQDLLDDGTLTDDDIETIAEAWEDGALDDLAETYPDLDLIALGEAIDELYDLFYDEYNNEGHLTDLAELASVDPELAQNILDMIAERTAAQMAASEEDSEGWAATMDLMTQMYPDASFIISGGDQVELKNAEWEYTGFFATEQLTSIPVAPTYASHDRALNFEYHFSLPNESTEYGQDSMGVGDYYFTNGNTLIMVLNMDVTNRLFPRGAPPGPPPGGGGGGPSTDTDGDGVSDDDDLCPNTYGDSLYGCPMTDEYDDDEDGVTNDLDLCGNTVAAHLDAGLISGITGCPYTDIDGDGIPDVEADGITVIDRCNNTDDDLTVGDDGCAECDYIETDDEHRAWLEGLEADGDLDDFNASLAEHEAFMTEAIEANPNTKWKIVVWHYSIYSAAMHSTDNQSEGIRYLFTPVLEDLGIDVVLMGHDHAYTRTHQMLGNEPQLDQTVNRRGEVVDPTGVLYLTASSSSGSKYYELNCNIGDESSDSKVYYDYAAHYDEYIPTFTYFEVDPNTLKLTSYTYLGDEVSGEYDVELIDEYAIKKRSRNTGR